MSRFIIVNGLLLDKNTNKKMYPVGNWERYQHVFYNYMDRCYNNMHDNYTVENMNKYQRSQELAGMWDFNPRLRGIVYAYYKDYKELKDIIGGYALRHNGYV